MENKGHVPNTGRSAVMIDFILANFLIILSKFTSLHIPFSSNRTQFATRILSSIYKYLINNYTIFVHFFQFMSVITLNYIFTYHNFGFPR